MEVNRRVGVAVDFSACSKKALKWALDNVVRDGDHLIILSVLPEGHYEEGEMQLWETTGSRTFLSFFSLRASFSISIVVVMKVYWGDAREKICEAIDNIPLSCLVIGNRGLGKIKRAILGSVSNYVVNNGSCPVTVVKNAEESGK
ncbi:hypothetical protein CK203_081023 [Vitis vinifera]|uniref:UspA domain-containing protein n=1 Tax=Vitis vinifera TaxID=29760 RepID=A0A438DX34_VITVI|nr:hypothetical protein CK203_081023 [Vitis vinifera]